MNARVRLVACALLAIAAASMTGCGLLTSQVGSKPSTANKVGTSGSTTASATPSATATAVTPASSFASEPTPKPADPILASGDWGYHSGIDYDDSGSGRRINSLAEQNERYKLIKEQYKKLLSALKKSKGVKRLVSAAGGDTDDIKYSVVDIDAMDLVGLQTPWVTATLRASFATEDGLKAVDVMVYRLKTAKGLNNTPYVSGTSVGFVESDGSITQPKHPAFPR
jgi:hypothetical protein